MTSLASHLSAHGVQRRRVGRRANANQGQRQRRNAALLQRCDPLLGFVLRAGDDDAGGAHGDS